MEVNINWNKFKSDRYRPLAVEDIPDFKPGTIAYDDYWDEQDNRCIKGYKPTPYMPRITGEHYFYLNMCKIELLKKGASRKTMDSPFYRELDRRLFGEIQDAKRNKFGLIIGKPRRVGLSVVGSTSTAYELLFHQGNKIGVAAGQEDKAQDFYEKVKDLLKNIIPEYRSGILVKNKELIKLGYEDRVNKQTEEKGLLSQLFMKTMYAKPTGFEGKTLSMVIFEEAGLFVDIIAAYKSTEPCFKEGMIQFGTPIIYGTGGDIEKGSKGYKAMWNKPKVYNLKKVLVTAVDYYPGDGIPDEKTKKIVSFFDFRTGRTNGKAAELHILKERAEKEGSEGFIKHIQSYPLKESDIFIKNSGGYLNRKKLNAQMRNQDNAPHLKTKGRLEWVTNDPQTKKLISVARNLKEIDKIHLSRKSKLVFKEDEELGTIHKILDPIDHKNMPYCPDIGGCDSYDEDNPGEHASLGATIIYRCFYAMNKPHDLPVAYILDRGTADQDDEFYSQTLRLSVWYGIELLVEYTKIAIINYFKDVGAEEYLKARPDLTGHGYSSRAKNEYGFKMPNQYAWTLTLRLMKAEVNMNFNNIWFLEILEHLVDYGESNSDLGSAYGMCMVSKLDLFGDISEGIDVAEHEPSVIDGMGFYDKVDGELVYTTYGAADAINYQNEIDEFDFRKNPNIRAFDPEYDLEGSQKEEYNKTQVSAKEEILKRRNEVLSKYGNDVMAFVIEEHKRDIDAIEEN
jgi:hypothetical protein